MSRSATVSRLLATLVFAACGAASAAPIQFSVTPSAFVTGAGYGVDANEATGTLLDVSFTASSSLQSFTLTNVGDSFSFDFGTIVLNESGQIRTQETDDLGVAAIFTFSDPLAGLRSVTASGNATFGPIVDAQIDFSLDWNTRQVAFGNGGLFEISMNTTNYRQTGATRTQTATVTLLAQSVPEPAGLALVATALLAGGVATRRRRG